MLREFPEFREFLKAPDDLEGDTEPPAISEQLDPRESIEKGYQLIREQLSIELLTTVKACSPAFFENLVVDLLVKMGYGGFRRESGEVTGKSGDGGIDGVIKQDKLGLDNVYLQAKRWGDGQVGSKEIQAFVGALHGRKANKGVFITTSGFSQNARKYAKKIQDKVVLIDGRLLAELLIDHGVGVSTTETYEMKRIDSDYFSEE